MANITSTSRIYTSDGAQARRRSGPAVMQLASSAWRQQWGDSRVFPAGMPSIFSPRRYRQPAIAAAASVLLPGPALKSTRTAASGSREIGSAAGRERGGQYG